MAHPRGRHSGAGHRQSAVPLSQFQDFPQTLFNGRKVPGRKFPHAFVQALLGYGADLIDDRHHVAAPATHRHEQGRDGLE